MPTSLHGVYSIYHHTLRLLWLDWRSRVDQVDLRGAARGLGLDREIPGPLELESAIHTLENGSRLLRLHGTVALSSYYWALGRPQRYQPTERMRSSADLIASVLRDARLNLDQIQNADSSGNASLIPLLALGCPLQDLWVRVNAGIGTNETTAAAGVSVGRSVTDVVAGLDPQAWQSRVPELFDDTYRTDASPDDPNQPAPFRPDTAPWEGLLYEQASWPLPPGLKVSVRNILRVSFDPTALQCQLRYSLYECLTGAIVTDFGDQTLFKAFGGIDRDSGFVDVRQVPGNAALTSVSGLKSIRFTRHLSFLNPFTPGYLFFWMTFLILGGACYSSHSELSPGEIP